MIEQPQSLTLPIPVGVCAVPTTKISITAKTYRHGINTLLWRVIFINMERIINISYRKEFFNDGSKTNHNQLVGSKEVGIKFIHQLSKMYGLVAVKEDNDFKDFDTYTAKDSYMEIRFFIDYDGDKIYNSEKDFPKEMYKNGAV